MDRLFLDANVLFSAAWRPENGLLQLWHLQDVVLASSSYSLHEAERNLRLGDQLQRLNSLSATLLITDETNLPGPVPGISLPAKDLPVLAGALDVRATHLLTGDRKHFGQYFNDRLAGVLILPPAQYLRNRQDK